MIKRICDRCNKEMQGNYWTISIYEEVDSIIKATAAGAVNNMAQIINKTLNRKKEYCKECIEEIAKVINKEVQK